MLFTYLECFYLEKKIHLLYRYELKKIMSVFHEDIQDWR